MDLKEVQSVIAHEVARDLAPRTDGDGLKTIAYMGLAEEIGEVCGLVKRELRGYSKDLERATKEHFVEELGDVLWYLAMCCAVEGTSLDEIWEYNRKKLEERYGQCGHSA